MQDKVDLTSKVWRKTVPVAKEAKAIHLGEFKSYDLENGLKVILVENHKRPTVSIQLSLNHEQILQGEEAGYVGIAGDLISKGTTTMSKSDIDKSIDFIGGKVSTSSKGIFASGLKKHSDKLMEIMSDMLLNASFPNVEFEKSKKQAITSLTMSLSNADAMISNVGDVLRYGKDHPYGEVQTIESTEKIKLSTCKQYYETYFVPNNAYLIFVGDITVEETKKMVSKYLSKWTSKKIPSFQYDLPSAPKGNKVAFVHKEGAVQSIINITYPVVLLPGSDDALKARIMNAILGGGMFSGRLMQNLREDKAYTYGARSRLSSDPMVGYFNAYAKVRNEVTDSSVTAFLYEIHKLANEKVSNEDLQLVKNSMTGSFARSLESPQTIARFARNTFKYNLPADYYRNYLKNLAAVTVDDVAIMSKKYLKPNNCHIIVAGDKAMVSNKLLPFDKDGQVDYYDAFGSSMKIIAPVASDMTVAKVYDRYIKSIGGKTKVMSVNSMNQVWGMIMMGKPSTMSMTWKANTKYMFEMKVGESVMQAYKFDGKTLKTTTMGTTKTIITGEEVAKVKEEAIMFPQMDVELMLNNNNVTIDGSEAVNGEDCYKIKYMGDEKVMSIEYYSMSSGLLLRKMVLEGTDEHPMNIVTEYKDYKVHGGIKYPSKMSISGVMPMALNLELKEVEVNRAIKDIEFEK